jgi:hypothetical protein
MMRQGDPIRLHLLTPAETGTHASSRQVFVEAQPAGEGIPTTRAERVRARSR